MFVIMQTGQVDPSLTVLVIPNRINDVKFEASLNLTRSTHNTPYSRRGHVKQKARLCRQVRATVRKT